MAEPSRALGRTAVVLAVTSAGTHVVLAADALGRGQVTAIVLVAMAAACLACTPALLRGGDTRSWMTMLGLTGLMLVAHVALCLDCGPAVQEHGHGHGHGHGPETTGIIQHLLGGSLGAVALWLMLAEIAVATTAVVRILSAPSPRAAVGDAANPNRR